MKLSKKLLPMAMAMTVAGPAVVATGAAHAEVSATLGAASMYLWRGLNLTPDGPQFSGSLDYAHESGFYAGTWITNETGGHETDLYLGFGGSVGDFGYDISYWKYLYPEDGGTGPNTGLGDTDASEVIVTGSYGPISVSAYIDAESPRNYEYYTISGEMGKFSLTYGFWDIDGGSVPTVGATAGTDEYTHITAGYAYNDNISFAISFAQSDLPETDTASVEEDPLFMVSYSKTFDM